MDIRQRAFYRQHGTRRWHISLPSRVISTWRALQLWMSSGVDAARKKDNISSRCGSRAWRELTLRSPRWRRMGTAEARFSHSGRRGQRSGRRRLVWTGGVPLVSEDNIRADDVARPGTDRRVKGPVTRRRVTCTQRIYRQLAHKATKPVDDEMLVDLTVERSSTRTLSPGDEARATLDPANRAIVRRRSFIRNRHNNDEGVRWRVPPALPCY